MLHNQISTVDMKQLPKQSNYSSSFAVVFVCCLLSCQSLQVLFIQLTVIHTHLDYQARHLVDVIRHRLGRPHKVEHVADILREPVEEVHRRVTEHGP